MLSERDANVDIDERIDVCSFYLLEVKGIGFFTKHGWQCLCDIVGVAAKLPKFEALKEWFEQRLVDVECCSAIFESANVECRRKGSGLLEDNSAHCI